MAEPMQIRTLRISASLDASQYEAGARRVAQASQTIAEANAAVVRSLTEQEREIELVRGGYTSFERRFVESARNARDFGNALEKLSRTIDENGYDAQRVSAILDGMSRKYGLMADAAVFAARGQHQLADAINEANLRMIESEVTARRKQQAEDMLRQQPVNDNRAGRQAAATNAMFQFQDIFTTAAGGMNRR